MLMQVAAESAPEILRLLGHDLRWQLVQALASSDRRVNELVAWTGERQNLVSYHLGLLRRAQLVSERRSSADARDIYYRLNLDHVAAELNLSAASLHPALVGHAARPTRGKVGSPPRVLFVCTGNSARSQMAEAILRKQARGAFEVFSAGPRPAGAIHPIALEVLSELGLPTKGLRSKGIEGIAGIDFDLVVTLCDIAREDCPPLPGHPQYVHWSVADPAAVTGSIQHRRRAFRAAHAELAERINHLIAQLTIADPGQANKSSLGGTR